MQRVYEIFEVLPNGSPRKGTVVAGLDSARAKLDELANHTANECFAADARTRQIVAMKNVPPSKWRATKHIFQISYDEQLGVLRAELLKSRGYGVVSVVDNEAAKLVLSPAQPYAFFIIGTGAPQETRQQMVFWLKRKYPRVKILAINPTDQEIGRADYNARQNGPENWLPILSKELTSSAGDPGRNKTSTGGA